MANALPAPAAARLRKITKAFKQDGFDEIVRFPDPAAPARMLPYCFRNDRLGVKARHNVGTERKPRYKNAFYVEGSHETMGWLLGLMAERDIARMTTEYMREAIPDFIHEDIAGSRFEQELVDFFLKIVRHWVCSMKDDIPSVYHQEIRGLCKGCGEANPDTPVRPDDLWELNLGTDAILSHVYTGELLKPVVEAKFLRVPLHCNFFAAPGDGNRRLFGRDFIFPTAGVYQDTACLIVYRPDRGNALVSQTAPGLIGCITGLNASGVAIGINMTASHLCDPQRPGFNGLLLSRYCMERARSARAAVKTVLDAQRGTAWVYPVGDATGTSFVIEAGKRIDNGPFPYLDFIPNRYRKHLPGLSYIQDMQHEHHSPPPDRGAFVRGADYEFPTEYIKDWNRGLWRAYNRNIPRKMLDLVLDLGKVLGLLFKGKLGKIGQPLRTAVRSFLGRVPWSPDYFGERGYISRRWTDRALPGAFLFHAAAGKPGRRDRRHEQLYFA